MTLPFVEIAAPDIASCANERIHIPGSIQPHGCLLSFNPDTLVVAQASANTERFLHFSAASLLDRPVTTCFSVVNAELLRSALSNNVEDVNPILLHAGTTALLGVLHRQDGMMMLEFEFADESDEGRWQSGIDRALKRLSFADDLSVLMDATVQIVRGMTGYDRVVIYRFDKDGSGEVMAEALSDGMSPYLGLHFPESDIPRQARELYRRNWIRAIPDARYESVPITPTMRPDTGAPLDLSFSILRSVSPVHLAYLANMGVLASLSVSLIVEGRLWGLISCGHREPRQLPYRVRSACETIGRLVSLQIGALQVSGFQRRQQAKTASSKHLVANMRLDASNVLAGLATDAKSLLEVAEARGAAIVTGDTVVCVGVCPPDDVVSLLAEWVRPRVSDGIVFATRQLSIDDPQWEPWRAHVSGVLAIVLPTPEQPCVLWFRPELIHTVNWGGKPPDADNGQTPASLSPRRSFQMWKQRVRGQALAWGDADVDAALNLRRFAIEIDLTRQVEKEQAAVKARDDLVAVVSHDLRTPLSVVVMQAAMIHRTIAQDDQGESSQRLRARSLTIQRAAEAMSALLQDLLDLAKMEAGRFVVLAGEHGLAHIFEDANELLQILAQAKGVALRFAKPPEVSVHVDPERISQVLSNLIGNAVKFSATGGTVDVSATIEGAMCEFRVSDTGVGIASDQLARIFERYWQAKPTDAVGSGLGLYIAKGIVEAHGGNIRAESTPGLGSTFIFTVPLVVPAAANQHSASGIKRRQQR